MDTAAKETRIKKLHEFGQSIWLDNIGRSIIDSGQLSKLIVLGVKGVTSNPSIFDKAISESLDYDDKIGELRDKGLNAFEIYDELTVRDIKDAADLFLPVFKQTGALDGYVSLEVDPLLAHKAEETVREAQRLHRKVDKINVLFKVPATDEGLEAGFRLLAQGINVNFTLIFSLEQYVKTANTFIKAAKEFLKSGGNLRDIACVASVFVSRIDSSVDKLIDEKAAGLNKKEKDIIQGLKGKAAVANSALIFAKYSQIFSASEFIDLEKNGLKRQRALWASTSTKNSAYSDIKYVTELIGKGTINTMPQPTIDAFVDHGVVKDALGGGAAKAEPVFKSLGNFGIDVNAVCGDLLKGGVSAFEKSFKSLLNTVTLKGEKIKI
ncbi:MAG: transaldolase [Candidatus Omnitrophica bacterium]|nr:transaldolase [Candidatus Omnitrophota bacterium]MDD5356295.1 transaldolase [Candidatus Omnitrophota bacterium]